MKPLSPTDRSLEARTRSVATMTDALVGKFGDQALSVAERQMLLASGEARETWTEIVERLRGAAA